MDVLGVNHVNRKKQQTASKRSKKPLKVVYISTPMKVKTSASEFRDLVQKLTGRDSDTARFMELNVGADHHQEPCDCSDHQQQQPIMNEASEFPLSISYSSEMLQPYSEASAFKSLSEHLQLDVLRSVGSM
ncbi:hypothetical protein I3843_13G013600 [Carya illinoinensis]|uniref:VQ domain-containing protein n=1 Tax=Carya illinoinensis TaxID=32201 RepID=A0A8T1NML0_CARIL|nr:hypothetical protein I3760_13G014700 [Carya illinoinensis]KAG6630404.1 hypothetical protein CIPAW_13G015100 [Carya illinoinensis]KAG6679929.1 hypothetical protein I3842_13G014900 [Carya illinoinensis]KAG7948549.1 hypothetical protein I3843_13G013600 [Carya illinoinensis]